MTTEVSRPDATLNDTGVTGLTRLAPLLGDAVMTAGPVATGEEAGSPAELDPAAADVPCAPIGSVEEPELTALVQALNVAAEAPMRAIINVAVRRDRPRPATCDSTAPITFSPQVRRLSNLLP